MKRNPRKAKWSKTYRQLHGKDVTRDSTFEFESKCNRPERYDRNLAENNLKSSKKIGKIRADRLDKYIERRYKAKLPWCRMKAVKEPDQSILLVRAPAALEKEPSVGLPKVQVNDHKAPMAHQYQ